MKKSHSESGASQIGKASSSAADGNERPKTPEPGVDKQAETCGSTTIDGTEDVSVLRSSTSLSTAQCFALKNLMCGQSMSQAAMGAGVSRATLYRWMNDDVDFRAAHNAWRRDTMSSAQSSVLALTDPAIRAVAGALEAGDAKTGLVILRSLGLLTPPTSGSTNAGDVRREQEIEQREREKKIFSAEMDAELPL